MPARSPVYFDHAATTPLDPRVFEEMAPYLQVHYGNPSSVHSLGRKARFAIEDARERIAGRLGAEPGEIIFTSGGTESNNLALKGPVGGGEVVTSASEHEAILSQAKTIKQSGRAVHILPPSPDGAMDPGALRNVVHRGTGLVSCMHVNNEVGVVNPIEEISRIARAFGAHVHCDAVQSVGLFDMQDVLGDIDLLSASAHKFYGPKGVGFLYVRGGVELSGFIEGGSQERRRRGGTENVPGIVGMAKAFELAVAERDVRRAHIESLRTIFVAGIPDVLPAESFVMNTPPGGAGKAAPHIVNIAFPSRDDAPIDGEMLILNLDVEGILVSSGSACTSGAMEPSHVLSAMGLSPETASAAVRFSFGKDNTREEVEHALERLGCIVRRMRGNGDA